MKKQLQITVWNEMFDEKNVPQASAVYPQGMHEVFHHFLAKNSALNVRCATFYDDERHGLSEELLDQTDVLIWSSHMLHQEISDEIINFVIQRVHQGMGLILFHSSLFSKLSQRLLGFNGKGKYREVGERERVWVVDQSHPIAKGIPESFLIPQSEMYGEPCSLPLANEVVFISWYEGGNVFRSGLTYHKGAGKVFVFSPGHCEYPILYQPEVQQVLTNAVFWAAPPENPPIASWGKSDPLEFIQKK